MSTTQKEGGAGAPFSLTADDVRAEAGPGQTSTTAVVADVSVPGTAATESSSVAFRRRAASILAAPLGAQTVPADASTLLHVQSLIATTSITFSGSKLVSTATSLLHQVQLVGGVIDIGTLKATATSVTDGAKVTTSTSGLQVSDVTVGGEPATIGPSGVQVGHNTGLTPAQIAQLNQALSQALGTAGWQVALLTASSSRTPDAPQASSQGIMLFSQVDASSLPEGATYYTSLVLGNASSQATADASGNPDLSLLGGVSTGGIPGSTLSGPIAGSGGALAPSLPGAAPSPASVSSTAGAPVALASPGSAGHGLAQDLGQPASGSPLLRSSAAASDGSAARLTTLAYLIAVVLGAVLALGSPVLLALLTGRRLPGPLAAVIRYRLGRA